MNNEVLKDVQQALNTIRALADKADAETKMAALQLILGTSQSVVALAKKLTTPNTKTKVIKAYLPKEKVAQKEPEQQQIAEPATLSQQQPLKPIPSLSNQRNDLENM